MYLADKEASFITRQAKIAQAASVAGIRSTKQLEIFLICMAGEGQCLSDLVGLASDTPEYKTRYAIARQLMQGSPCRDYRGANLLRWGEPVYGKEKAVLLTSDGERLGLKILALA